LIFYKNYYIIKNGIEGGFSMSIGFVAGGGSTEIQTNQIQANSGQVSTERKADSVVRSIINLLIDNALAASGDAFFNAAKRGRIEVVDTLLKGEPIDKFYLSKALHSAAENGHTEIIKRLLLNGRINDEDRGIAMQNAAKNGHTEIIRRLLRNGPISDEDRGLAGGCGSKWPDSYNRNAFRRWC
jgi:hypothetical protein